MTDDELNALFAEHVAGIERIGKWLCKQNYVNDANAVLPWLEKAAEYWEMDYIPERVCPPGVAYSVSVAGSFAEADTFPRAAVIALLRAKGIEV